jgi:lipopolysaccharide export LptBFGC system permease protein LptF
MPAMMSYSLPIAALFATTVVYGRLAADNELTACRAAGISFLSISLPAFILGLCVLSVSLLLLCFIVPRFTLKVEQVVYSNLAQLVANQIDRTRQIKHDSQVIYAQSALAQPPDPAHPREQMVTLNGVMIVSYGEPLGKSKMRIPSEFYLAKAATILIHRGGVEDDEYSVEVLLEDGSMFPRDRKGKLQGGLKATRFGPVPIDSPIEENMKFKDIFQLHTLLEDPSRSQRVQREMIKIVREDQASEFLNEVAAAINGSHARFRFDAGNETFELVRTGKLPAEFVKGKLIVPGAQWIEERAGVVTNTADVEEVRIAARATPDDHLAITADLHAANFRAADGQVIGHQSLQRPFNVAMSKDIKSLADRPVNAYLADTNARGRGILIRELIVLNNNIQSELHARMSFALSCLILVMVGAALGMMFRSGNFLTAFAISVAPALMCIALIATGQHTAESVPWNMEHFKNGLNTGITLIWSGNVMVLVLAVVLMWRLQRQ